MISDVRMALGGVAHKPWRASVAERSLRGSAPTPENFAKAAAAELEPAIPRRDNAFKIELAKRTIALVLSELFDQRRRRAMSIGKKSLTLLRTSCPIAAREARGPVSLHGTAHRPARWPRQSDRRGAVFRGISGRRTASTPPSPTARSRKE